jgi:glycosyltransferase involved in cell wall biosynthesis
VSEPLVVVDADVLGRRRTGDETYVAELLRELPPQLTGVRLAAVTRRPDLVAPPVEPIELRSRSQPLRMAVRLPMVLRRSSATLGHFLHVIPPAWRGRSVLTVQDLSFERFPDVMSRTDRFWFRAFVPRSARRADRIVTGSESTKRDLIERYAVASEKVVVTPYGVDGVFRPDGPRTESSPYVLFVGALQVRKNPELALRALAAYDPELRLVLAGPDRGLGLRIRELVAELGLTDRVEVTGHVPRPELAALYRGAAALLFPSLYEGFGLPVLEAMASGTPVVTTMSSSIPEVAGQAAILAEPDPDALAAAIERAIAERPALAAAGLEQAKRFSWAETARRTADVYRELL